MGTVLPDPGGFDPDHTDGCFITPHLALSPPRPAPDGDVQGYARYLPEELLTSEELYGNMTTV